MPGTLENEDPNKFIRGRYFSPGINKNVSPYRTETC